MYNKCLGEKFGYISKYSEDNEPKNIKEFKDKGKGKKSSDRDMGEKDNNGDTESLVTTFHALDSCESFDTYLVLTQTRPAHIILYDCDMTFVRQVEAFQAASPELAVRVYFLLYKVMMIMIMIIMMMMMMMYKGSVEEQAYLTTLRREKAGAIFCRGYSELKRAGRSYFPMKFSATY